MTRVDWSAKDDDRLEAQDRLFVLATRAGLGRVVARSRPDGGAADRP
jgi:hypothetical protein